VGRYLELCKIDGEISYAIKNAHFGFAVFYVRTELLFDKAVFGMTILKNVAFQQA
jgi:hypothetical protein